MKPLHHFGQTSTVNEVTTVQTLGSTTAGGERSVRGGGGAGRRGRKQHALLPQGCEALRNLRGSFQRPRQNNESAGNCNSAQSMKKTEKTWCRLQPALGGGTRQNLGRGEEVRPLGLKASTERDYTKNLKKPFGARVIKNPRGREAGHPTYRREQTKLPKMFSEKKYPYEGRNTKAVC